MDSAVADDMEGQGDVFQNGFMPALDKAANKIFWVAHWLGLIADAPAPFNLVADVGVVEVVDECNARLNNFHGLTSEVELILK